MRRPDAQIHPNQRPKWVGGCGGGFVTDSFMIGGGVYGLCNPDNIDIPAAIQNHFPGEHLDI
jgi:hypothetical protein